jgi:nitroreductase
MATTIPNLSIPHTIKEFFENRYCCREFKNLPVSLDILSEILNLVLCTLPTAGNLQGYRIIIGLFDYFSIDVSI